MNLILKIDQYLDNKYSWWEVSGRLGLLSVAVLVPATYLLGTYVPILWEIVWSHA